MKEVNSRPYTVYILRSTGINPDPRAMKTAVWLYHAGYTVRIIGWDRNCDSAEKENVNGVDVKRFRIPSSYGKGIRNIFQLFLFNIKLFCTLFKDTPDAIHACDLDTVVPAMLIKKIKKVKIVYDIYDFYAESRRVGKLEPLIRWIERYISRKSDFIILAHEKRIEQLGKLPPIEKKKVITIYNTPEDIQITKRSGIVPLHPFFSYVGILSHDRGLLSVIDAVAELNNVRLVLAGFGSLEQVIMEKALLGNNTTFLGKIPYEDAIIIQGSSLAIIAMYDPLVPNNRYAAPNKLYEAAMLGKPVITSEGTLFADIVKQEGIGYVVPYGDVEKLKNACLDMLCNNNERVSMGKKSRKLYEEIYSADAMRKVLTTKYKELFKRDRTFF
ncbi:glycosyltransferase family 4 protein [Aneurinibacillus migulanus]|uniref:glycosyltransferase family 4 protein n=1 Tax=Aneurinibacillus migulanus TaxID=47500 RepID=UPI002E231833|nr:glycosyltransferase family 4 protein [Aneurinibacillus migulanus]